jgi:Succinylglutamate desuccinylase / Aspartoacylase family
MTKSKLKTLFVGCCTHGDEQVGLPLHIKYLSGQGNFWKYETTICNPRAVDLNQRYTDQDLNRSFPGILGGNYEQNRAFQITQKLKEVDFIIDIHQTTAINNTSLIVNKLSQTNYEQLFYFDIENVIIDNLGEAESFDFSKQTNITGGICLDSVFPDKSITVEYSKTNNPQHDFAQLDRDFINFTNRIHKFNNKKFYTFIGHLNKTDCLDHSELSNFVELTLQQKTKYNLATDLNIFPCFIGEKSYTDIYCFWLKKIGLKQTINIKSKLSNLSL